MHHRSSHRSRVAALDESITSSSFPCCACTDEPAVADLGCRHSAAPGTPLPRQEEDLRPLQDELHRVQAHLQGDGLAVGNVAQFLVCVVRTLGEEEERTPARTCASRSRRQLSVLRSRWDSSHCELRTAHFFVNICHSRRPTWFLPMWACTQFFSGSSCLRERRLDFRRDST